MVRDGSFDTQDSSPAGAFLPRKVRPNCEHFQGDYETDDRCDDHLHRSEKHEDDSPHWRLATAGVQ